MEKHCQGKKLFEKITFYFYKSLIHNPALLKPHFLLLQPGRARGRAGGSPR